MHASVRACLNACVHASVYASVSWLALEGRFLDSLLSSTQSWSVVPQAHMVLRGTSNQPSTLMLSCAITVSWRSGQEVTKKINRNNS